MTLMALCLVFMMVHALMQTTGIALLSSATFYDREQALQAAQSGIDYAVSQLQTNNNWRGDSNLQYWSGVADSKIVENGGPSQPVYVAESNGNVVGIIRTKSGSVSAFRLKFSYEDSSEATYKKATMSQFGDVGSNAYKTELPIASPFVSINNLNSNLSALVYRANNNGQGIDTKPDLVEPVLEEGTEFACTLPAQRVCLIAEGLAGKALRDVKSPKQVTELANSSNAVVRRYVEAWYSSIPPLISNDAAYARDNVEFSVKNKLFVSRVNDKQGSVDKSTVPSPGSMRSHEGSIAVTRGVLNTFSREGDVGHLVVGPEGSSTFNHDKATYVFKNARGKDEKYTFSEPVCAKSQAAVGGLSWDDVVKANDDKANSLKSGFYQWHKAPSSDAKKEYYELRYYENGCKYDANGCPQPVNATNYKIVTSDNVKSGTTVDVDGKKIELLAMAPEGKVAFVTDKDGNITEPSLQVKGNLLFAGVFVLGSDVTEVTGKSPLFSVGKYNLPSEAEGAEGQDKDNKSEEGVLTATGNVYVANSVTGTGSLIAKGDVTMLGESLLEAGESGIGIYSGGSVTMKSLEMAIAKTPSGDSISAAYTDSRSASRSTVKPTDPDTKKYSPGKETWKQIWDTIGYKSKLKLASKNLSKNWYSVQFSAAGSGLPGSNGDSVRDNCSKYTRMSDNDRADIETWYKEKFGVYISVRYIYFQHDKNGDTRLLGYEFVDEDGVRVSGSKRCYDVWEDGSCCCKEAPADGSCNSESCKRVSKHSVPRESIVDETEENELVSAEINKYIGNFGSVSYGDQVVKGVIYAHDNFTADLGDNYNLVVTGAIKAENGSIKVNCKNSRLNYEENNINRLLANRKWLTRCFWTCW